MGKLQPNFSWQKYLDNDEDAKDQFQHQLQQQHILVANAVNTTIDDLSYFSTERVTSFRWLDGTPIYTKTISGVLVGSTTNMFPHGIVSISQLVDLRGTAQASIPLAGVGVPLPFLDPVTLANSAGLYVTPTDVVITLPNGNFNGYLFNVTITYTKV